MDQMEIALEYGKKGIKIFPVSKNKSPVVDGGHNSATISEGQIRTWWTKHPNALIGAPNDQFTVFDIDWPHGFTEGMLLAKITSDKFLEHQEKNNVKLVHVVTGNNGDHYYFKKDESLKRTIRCLPFTDILAHGGFVILPDNKTYITPTTDTPWECFDDLPELDTSWITSLIEEMKPWTNISKDVETVFKKSNPSKKLTKSKEKSKDVGEIVELEEESLPLKRGDVIYDVDYTKNLLSEDGRLRFELSSLTPEKRAEIFYNRDLQTKICKHMNIPVPKILAGGINGWSEPFSSLLPSHKDENPSMASCWYYETGSHILIRDFSEKYGKNKSVYNLPNLYAVCKYKSESRRPKVSSSEFNIWWLRLLYDAGILDISNAMREYDSIPLVMSNPLMKYSKGILLLDALNRLGYKYDGTFIFSLRFACAWCGMSAPTVQQAKREILETDMVFDLGKVDCSGGKCTTDFYETTLFMINGKE